MITRRKGQASARPKKRRVRVRRWAVTAALVGLVLYGVGFAFFVADLPQPAASMPEKANAIVALTGQGGRLGPAMTLLQQGTGKRLLITGVNRLISRPQLKTLLHGGDEFDCCVDLGFAATDTSGNAEEAAQWVRAHGYKSLIVVTAAYHMPRSLIEFKARMPEVKLVAFPVSADSGQLFSWGSVRRLNGEYVKYVASALRVRVAGAFGRA